MNKLRSKIRSVLYKMSIKTKLLLVSLTLILLPLTITCTIMYYNVSNMMMDSVYKVSGLSLDYTVQVLSDRLTIVQNIANSVSSNLQVNKILSHDSKNYSYDDQITDSRVLLEYLKNLENDLRFTRVRLTVNDGLLYSNEGYNFINSKNKDVFPWTKVNWKTVGGSNYIWANESDNNIVKNSNYISTISCIKLIHNSNDFNEISGMVCVDISFDEIKGILSKANLTKDAFMCVFSADERVLTTIGTIGSIDKVVKLSTSSETLNNKEQSIDGTLYQIHTRNVEINGWKIITLLPLEQIKNDRNRMLFFTILLIISLTLVTFFIGFLLYQTSLKRIKNIVEAMKSAQAGSLNTSLVVHGEDEIGKMEKNYNYMITRIRKLIEETYSLVQKARISELKSLQAQINPHFLYNTINTISWTALDYGAERVCKMLKALSDFYKLSIQTGKQEVTVDDEIRHVEAYIEIQNMRYDDAFTLEVNIPKYIREYEILNMIFQPLVENSIIHGIMAKEDRRGKILLNAIEDGDDIVLSVIDDGIGIEKETLKNLLADLENTEDYGIFNINERLVLRYGKPYKLNFESKLGSGTRVDVRIPSRTS